MTRRFEVTAEADLVGDATLTLEDHGVVVDGAEPLFALWMPDLFTRSFRVTTARTIPYSTIERGSIRTRRGAVMWLGLLVITPAMVATLIVNLAAAASALDRTDTPGAFSASLVALLGAVGLWLCLRATRTLRLTLRYRKRGLEVRVLHLRLRSPARLAELQQALITAVDNASRYAMRAP